MSFNKSDIDKIAHLARLEISNNERFSNNVTEDLNHIVTMIDQIKQVDANCEPMFHPHDIEQRLRDDLVTEQNVRNEMQSIVPENGAEDGLYIVPLVVE